MVADAGLAAAGGAEWAVELAISRMTCASCAAQVEKKRNKLDGVTAAAGTHMSFAWLARGSGTGAVYLAAGNHMAMPERN